MKKVHVFLFIGLVFFGSCSAQNVNAQSSNDAQRIVGTWIYSYSNTSFIFNSNGTYTSTSSGNDNEGNGNYFLSGSKLYLKQNNSEYAYAYECYLSPSGRILVIHLDRDSDGYWFEKQ